MAEFTLKPKEESTIRINIGEDSYQVPLAMSLTLKEAEEASSFDGSVAFFKKYIPEEVADALTVQNWYDIMMAWKDASMSMADGSLTPGES